MDQFWASDNKGGTNRFFTVPVLSPMPLTLHSVPSRCAHTGVCAQDQGRSLHDSCILLEAKGKESCEALLPEIGFSVSPVVLENRMSCLGLEKTHEKRC